MPCKLSKESSLKMLERIGEYWRGDIYVPSKEEAFCITGKDNAQQSRADDKLGRGNGEGEA